MFKRLVFLGIMMGAIGLPYLATSSSQWMGSFGERWLGGTTASESSNVKGKSGAGITSAVDQGNAANTSPLGKSQPIEGPTTHDLAEVIQFEGSPSWVLSRWPRVTAGLAELDLQGYRVPLVTGTAEDDLAGSLTYYFDKNQRIARISFHGSTGDPRKLIALVSTRYNFLRQETDNPSIGLYQVKWNGKALSELRIRPARVVRANQPRARYEIDLAIKRP